MSSQFSRDLGHYIAFVRTFATTVENR